MIKKLLPLLLVTFLFVMQLNAQVTIFTEYFEDATYADGTNLSTSNSTGWSNANSLETDHILRVNSDTRTNPISRNPLMAVIRNTPLKNGGIKLN